MSGDMAESVALCSCCEYVIFTDSIVGRGGFGTVYAGRIRNCKCGNFCGEELVAVKEVHLSATTAKREEEKRLLRRTCRLLLTLCNANLVRYYKLKLTKDKAEILMDYCPDGNLHEYIEAANEVPEKPKIQVIADFGNQIALGLQYLHQNKIIHTDLKPQNILRKPAGNGACRLLIGDVDDCILIAGDVTGARDITSVRGTVRFMSPEMIFSMLLKSEDLQCGRKTDIWSLGCILIDLMDCHLGNVGVKVYTGADGREKFLKIGDMTTGDFFVQLFADGYRPKVPRLATFENIVELCLFEEPSNRSSAAYVVEKLARFITS